MLEMYDETKKVNNFFFLTDAYLKPKLVFCGELRSLTIGTLRGLYSDKT